MPYVLAPVEAAYESAGLANQQDARGEVLDGRAADLHEPVEHAGGDAGEFERDGRPQLDVVEGFQQPPVHRAPDRLVLSTGLHRIKNDPPLARRMLLYLDRCAGHVVGPESSCGRPKLTPERASGGAYNGFTVDEQRGGHGDERVAAHEVRGAIDRIDDPATPHARIAARAFTNYRGPWVAASKDVHHGTLGGSVNSGDVPVVEAAG